MSKDSEARLAALEAWQSSSTELIRHLQVVDRHAANEALLVLLLQGFGSFDEPDSEVMERFRPLLNNLKKSIHASDFDRALGMAWTFQKALGGLRQQMLADMGNTSTIGSAAPRDPKKSKTDQPRLTLMERVIASMPADWLKALSDVQVRIDEVAEDLKSGKHLYASLDPWELGELLGLDWEDRDDDAWTRCSLGLRRDLPDDPEELAELVPLLEGQVSEARYAKLEAIADQILSEGKGRKLPLTKKEHSLLETLYSEREAPDGHTFGLEETTLSATDGTELCFQVLIGDSGDLEDPAGPYEHAKGKFLDRSQFIEIEEY